MGALWLFMLAVLPLVWIAWDDYSSARAYRLHCAEETARLAARTPEQIEAEAQMACILVAGDFFPQISR